MKHIKLFKTEAEYETGVTALPCVSYVESTNEVHFDEKHAVDRVYNAPLMNMCVAKGWAKESENYLTYEEAAVVSVINIQDLITYNVESAWEFKHFTGVTTISYDGLTGEQSTKLKYLYIPDNYASTPFNIRPIVNNVAVLLFPNIIKMHHSGVGQYPSYQPDYHPTRGESDEYNNSILYIPAGITRVGDAAYLAFFKTIIAMCNPVIFGDEIPQNVAKMTLYVKDEDVEAWQALIPWSKNPSSVRPLSEYTGDTDY